MKVEKGGRPGKNRVALVVVISTLKTAPLVVATHVFYGIGFWRGLFTQLKAPGAKPATTVVLERVPVEA